MSSRKPTVEYIRQEAAAMTMEQVRASLDDQESIGAQIAATRGRLNKHLPKIELLGRFVADTLKGDYRAGTASELQLAAFTFHYLVADDDLIPDHVPVAGFSDDIEVVLIVWELLESRLRDYAKWRGLHLDRFFGPCARE